MAAEFELKKKKNVGNVAKLVFNEISLQKKIFIAKNHNENSKQF